MAGLCTSNVEFDRSHVVLSVGHIWLELFPRTVFAVVVFEMYSLIGSLVIMRDHKAVVLMGMFACALRFKYGWFRHHMVLHVVQKMVHARFNRVYIRHMCFICQVRLGRSYWTSPHVT